ncbi:MAG: VWA domain-containing protein, partial [Desulfovibrionaceae bacterium]|nr:VWA domain-containing protein [Desulfovibrionaceae bacterium]
EAAQMALAHRTRQAPPRPESEPEKDHEHEPPEDRDAPRDPERPENDRHSQGGHGQRPGQDQDQDPRPPDADQDQPSQGQGPGMESVFAAGEPFRVKPLDLKRDRRPRTGSGKRTRSRVRQKSGRYVKSRVSARPTDLALDATLRAAAPHQAARDKNGLAVSVKDQDLRQRIREKRLGHLIVLAVDASGSMGAGQRMVASKGAVLSLLLDAYQKRDKVALVAFRGDQGQVLLPPTGSIDLALKRLEELPTGGKTPLSHGLASAFEVLDTQLRRDPDVLPLLVLVSDGRANVSMGGGKPLAEALRMAEDIRADGRIQSLVVDVERPGLISLGLAKRISASLGARYFKIDDLRARDLAAAVAEALA